MKTLNANIDYNIKNRIWQSTVGKMTEIVSSCVEGEVRDGLSTIVDRSLYWSVREKIYNLKNKSSD